MDTTNEEISSIRTESCPSLSGRSTITYEIGSKGESQYIRLSGNSAGGLFCKEWMAMADIQALLSGNPNITSKSLQSLFQGRSSNSKGFMLAALVHEKLCSTGKETPSPEVPPKNLAKKVTSKKIQN